MQKLMGVRGDEEDDGEGKNGGRAKAIASQIEGGGNSANSFEWFSLRATDNISFAIGCAVMISIAHSSTQPLHLC